MVKIDRLHDAVPIRLPRHTTGSTKKHKSCFIDRNGISRVKIDLGTYDYHSLHIKTEPQT